MRLTTPLRVAVTCAALALGATACGPSTEADAKSAAPAPSTAAPSSAAPSSAAPSPTGPDLSALSGGDILKQSAEAFKSAGSVKIDMSATDNGKSITVKLAADSKGDCTGNVAMGSKGSYDIARTPGHTWIKPDATFWKTIAGPKGDMAAELFKGRWLTGPEDDQNLKNTTGFCNIAEMGAQMTDGNATKGDPTTANGKPALVLHVTGSDGTKTDVWVSAQGKPVPLKSASDDHSAITFSDYGVPVTVTAPAADSVIDTAKLKQATGS